MNCWSRLGVLLFFFSSFSLSAQQLITAYSVNEGLPQSTVTSLYRDNDGYLWCGTGAGLGLYDGWEFHTPKKSNEKENPSLSSAVRGIISSADQSTIWVGTESTVNQFDRYNYRILRSFDVSKKGGIGEVPLYANDTAVWVICWAQGLYRVRIADGKATQLTATGYKYQAGMAADGQTVIYTDTTQSIVTYNIVTNAFRKFPLPASLRNAPICGYHTLPGSQNNILVLTVTGLWEMELNTGNFRRHFLHDPAYTDSLMDFRAMDIHPDGSWWFGVMGKGVFRYDTIAKKLRPCLWQQDGTFAGKLMTAPTSIVCDAYGVVWCGTDGSGLVKLLHNRVAFHSKYTSNLVTDTCNWFIRCFYELSAQKYLVGTFQQGLKLVDHSSGTVRQIALGVPGEAVTPLFITESGDGRLLIGTDNNVVLLDTTTWQSAPVYLGSAINGRFIGYLRLSSGRLLVYGNKGLREFSFSPSPMLSEPLGNFPGNPTDAMQLRDGRVVVAVMYNGLVELDPALNLLHTYPYDKYIGMPVMVSIRGMIEDENGMLWLGCESGLYQLNSDFKFQSVINSESGLSDNTVYGIEPMNNQTIAVATGHGITLFNIAMLTFTSYSGADGLPSDECNSGALLFSASTGLLYVGTTTGFARWNPLETSTCFGKPRLLASYGNNESDATGVVQESIIRDYGSGSIELNIWLTDFAFPGRVEFTKQLEGSGEAPVKETGLRKVTYAALGSGFYSFLCSAHVPGCEEIPLTKLLTIKIVPPFWMSGWFIGISSMGAIVIITLVLFIIMRLNYQRKIRKLKMQQELDKVRQRISRDIHDEIGAGLTRIALSGDLMSQRMTAENVTQEKLKWIAGTARELSQSMKEVVWSINPHYDSLDHMAAYFRSYVSGVAEETDVRFVYSSDENLPAMQVNPETRRNLLLILKETISNAVKYAQASELRLELHYKNGRLSMLIADNGKGFDLQSPDGVNSNGLRNIRQRAEASGCLVTISSSAGKGTSIHISGPIEKQ